VAGSLGYRVDASFRHGLVGRLIVAHERVPPPGPVPHTSIVPGFYPGKCPVLNSRCPDACRSLWLVEPSGCSQRHRDLDRERPTEAHE
jgi:hypothetical protein